MFALDIFNKHFQTPFQLHFTDEAKMRDIINTLEYQVNGFVRIFLRHGYNEVSMPHSDYAGYRVTDLTDATNFQLELKHLQSRIQQEFMTKPRIIPVKSH